MKQFQKNASDILGRIKDMEEFCDVTLVSEDGEKFRAHKVVLSSASTLLREMFQNNEEAEVISMKGIPSRFTKAFIDLVYNGETNIKKIECEEFINILKEYRVTSDESVKVKDNKDTQGKFIKKLEAEIKHQKEDIVKFQSTFNKMKGEIYSLRTDNKELKDYNADIVQKNKRFNSTIVTEKKEMETQTVEEANSKDNNYYGKIDFQFIACKYFNKGNGCRRGETCWFSHKEKMSEEKVCHFWLGKCRYADSICRSGQHGQHRSMK